MTESNHEILKGKPQRLARLMALALEKRPASSEPDLQAVLRGMLDTPLREVVRAIRSPAGSAPREERKTIRELLRQPEPVVEWLEEVKEFARRRREGSAEPQLQKAATVLYYAAIAAAPVRGGNKITRLSDTKLREGFNWVLAQSWVDAVLKQLIIEAAKSLKPGT